MYQLKPFGYKTDSFYLIVLEIGNGTTVSGNISSIPWGDDIYYLKTELDPAGGTSYTGMGQVTVEKMEHMGATVAAMAEVAAEPAEGFLRASIPATSPVLLIISAERQTILLQWVPADKKDMVEFHWEIMEKTVLWDTWQVLFITELISTTCINNFVYIIIYCRFVFIL